MIPREILKKIRQIEIRTNRLVNDMMVGAYLSHFKGRGMDFEELREYIPGDEVRDIDWNVTYRMGRPFVKRGGVAIILNPVLEFFHPEYHYAYRRFFDEVLAAVREWVAGQPADAPLRGYAWMPDSFEERSPRREWLDEITVS